MEEHLSAEEFLCAAYGSDAGPADAVEADLLRAVERDPALRARLADLGARLREMDALGQDMAVLSPNTRGVQPFPAADAVPPARRFNDALAGIA